jgi:hypothetical protein
VPGVLVAVCTRESELELEDEEPDPERSARIARRKRSLKAMLVRVDWCLFGLQVFNKLADNVIFERIHKYNSGCQFENALVIHRVRSSDRIELDCTYRYERSAKIDRVPRAFA